MISYCKNSQINFKKYDSCIKSSINSRIYAYSWYLNIVADNWDLLILNDYEAVMPLPWRSKYFIKYIYPPAWTQQLGIFSKIEISEELIIEFINSIPKKFKKITIQFNSKNIVNFKNTSVKTNYILPLNCSYKELYYTYSKNRKRDLKKAIDAGFIVEDNVLVNEFLNFYLKAKKTYSISSNQIATLQKLVRSENLSILGVKLNNELIAAVLFIETKSRIVYLLPEATLMAKKNGVPTLLIDYIIQNNANSNLVSDFEGSMLEGVANFYKSFGSKQELYFEHVLFKTV